MPAITLDPSGTPKRNLIELAFEECGSAGYEFERTPDEINSALRELNAMMYEWPFNLLGYEQAAYGTGDPANPSGIPNDAISAVAKMLALRICPKMGATQSPESKAALSRSMLLLQSQYATIPSLSLGNDTVSGAGNRWRSAVPFINEAPDETA